ncbi:MAG: CDGSH iron-sulfur domain-containing protein [Actinobacteria bacterium]|nr:CDGSH iron-sulfur domain-containing protein [Actinomycetota bacterium]
MNESQEPRQRGRLAQVIATRGGKAPPEAPFVIEHREALIYMLCEAAELEHGIMCQYLYAAFSLKQSRDEGLTEEEQKAVTRWRKQILHIAAQEMLHMSLVQNLLSAVGAAPHLSRPNYPQPASHYPAGVHLALVPFGDEALRHFMFLERPEGMDLADAEGMAAFEKAAPVTAPAVQIGDIVPRGQDFATVGHLYRSIEAGIAHLAAKFGEEWLFVGPPRAQATQAYFGWPELVAVTDVASAQQAIDEILEQGEGPRGHWREAHFGQFVEILDEYTSMRADNPAFDPVRPVTPVNVRPAERDVSIPLAGDPVTAQVMDLFNVSYEILLLMLQRFFAHTEETDAQLKALADASVSLMFAVIEPLGNLVTTLPAGPRYPGRTAGPSFELFYESDYVLPHREAAWILLTERIRQAAEFCQPGAPCDPAITDALTTVRSRLNDIADALCAHLPARDTQPPAPAEDLQALLARAADLYRTTLGAPLTDGSPREMAVAATAERARLGTGAPPGLLEAAAALQYAAVRLAPAAERAGLIAELGQLQREVPPGIVTAPDGPYLVTNVATVRDHLGQGMTVPPQLALCRCGGSAIKPSCDGACHATGFTDAKDPHRVPDRRDTYDGEQVTIYDNRGICQHSGLCTDRAPAAFRTDKDPFVAPSGARMDELVRAVRDCPSGALSLAFDSTEARDLADWHGRRAQAIEVTRDGPYRVTGGIPLGGADGADVPRAQGSSREHYALCRCGHSQNKPFCSGMHWYVEFRDPVRRPGAEPTLFEWAGGLPALTRLTRLLYAKHVPADDLLAPLFADMAPDHPQREAARIAEAFGGPPAPQASPRPAFTEPQRARWVTLAIRAADEAVLPAEPEFRAALSSYLEWMSRAADGARVSWDWGPAGPPAEDVARPEADDETPVTLPGPDEPVSFAAHIKPLFREHDRKSMAFAFDLWSQDDVQAHAAGILERLVNGTMPCDGAWPAEKIQVFQRWTESGFLP